MLRWCAYCQRYLGVTAPLNLVGVTHGLCQRCHEKGAMSDSDLVRGIKPLAAFFRDIFENVRLRALPPPGDLIRGASRLGIRPSDLVVGVLCPLLREVAERQDRGESTIRDEHKLSAFTEQVITLLRQVQPAPSPGWGTVLLACSESNFHTLPVHVLEIVLRDYRIPVETYVPGMPYPDLAEVACEMKPCLVGISVHSEEELAGLTRLESAMREAPSAAPILVGGPAVFGKTPAEFGLARVEFQNGDLAAFVERAEQAARGPSETQPVLAA